MKIKDIFRMQVAAIAVGAALLLAGATRAQDADTPHFDQGSNSVALAQKVTLVARNTSNAAVLAVQGSANASNGATEVQEGVVPVAPPMEGWMAAALFFTIVLGIFYVRTERRRRIGSVQAARPSRVGRAVQES